MLHTGMRAVPASGRESAALPNIMGTAPVLYATGRVTDSAGARRASPQPGAACARPYTLPGSPPCTVADLFLAWRVFPCPSSPGAGDGSLRPQAAPDRKST